MSQFDFGTIDPFVVDGVTLASFLNQWRDAVHSLHRGPARPDYAVPGTLWVNDSGGAANWVVNVYMGPAVGDRRLFAYDTASGSLYMDAASLVAAPVFEARSTMQWFASANPAGQKYWRAAPDGVGILRFDALDDAGAVLATIQLNRDGTMRGVAPPAADNSTLVPTTAWVRALLDAAAGIWNVGDVRLTYRQTPTTGWLFLDDTTMGNTGSGAAHVGAAYQNLYNVLWPIPAVTMLASDGSAAAKGADAATDWTSLKRLTLAKTLGRAIGIAGAGAGLTARTLASIVGVENQTSGQASFGVGTGPPPGGWVLTDPGHTHPVNVMQPTTWMNAEIKL